MKANPLGLLAILSITRLTESTRKSFKKPNIYQQTGTNQFNEGQHVNICDSHRLQVDRSSGKPFVDSLQWCEKRDLYEIGNELQHAQTTPPPPPGQAAWSGRETTTNKERHQCKLVLRKFQFITMDKTFLKLSGSIELNKIMQ